LCWSRRPWIGNHHRVEAETYRGIGKDRLERGRDGCKAARESGRRGANKNKMSDYGESSSVRRRIEMRNRECKGERKVVMSRRKGVGEGR
jgi:hypothetical protein